MLNTTYVEHTNTDQGDCPACQQSSIAGGFANHHYRVPVETPGIYESLSTIAAALRELAELQRQLLAALGTSSSSRSSVELEDMASGKTKLTTKVYDGSPVGNIGDEALAEHGRVHRLAEARAMQNWAETVEMLTTCGLPIWDGGPPCEYAPGHPLQHGRYEQAAVPS